MAVSMASIFRKVRWTSIRTRTTTGFDCDAYFAAEVENIRHTRKVFRKSQVVQYVNSGRAAGGDERGYFTTRFFEIAAREHIGVGGPDIVPNRPGQMKNSYPSSTDTRTRYRSWPWPFRTRR